MEKEKYDAKVKQAKGSLREAAGRLTGDRKREAKGTAEKLSGKIKEKAADAKEAVKNASNKESL
ncbi:CsbD family protein [Streptococcus chenjunshii]|uniref:CsbD family protein n=1 Tax=Streptococcus chenjunshii TaxID=2173853 RepID=A0A372KNU8_9STRE|nr:CsbD family protein [Streptococcus chenjunshii]AXQ79695.1 CsbD family protein [Streptococcus chenjunshii]RFU51865.1 CsbD family protein [Streptococcus chenjunshii]RFU53952.1 CsbD family protein [Streptococcus chenjunshii]